MTEPTSTSLLALPPAALAEYQAWLGTIKQRIVSVRLRMALAASRELIQFYWDFYTGGQGVSAPDAAAAAFGQQPVDRFPWDIKAGMRITSGLRDVVKVKCGKFGDSLDRAKVVTGG